MEIGLFGRFKRIGLKFGASIFTSIAGVIIGIMASSKTSGTIIAIVSILYSAALIIILMVYESQKIKTDEAEKKQREAEEKAKRLLDVEKERQMLAKDKQMQLVDGALSGNIETLKDILHEIIDKNNKIESLLSEKKNKILSELKNILVVPNKKETNRNMHITRIIGDICNNYLRAAKYDPMHYFKATIFEPSEIVADRKYLERAYYKYPANLIPHTLVIDEGENPNATAIEAWKRKNLVTVESIQKLIGEKEKNRDKNNRDIKINWEDLYKDQHKQYGSMVCKPIINGLPWADEAKLKGILTVDTNIDSYFMNNQEGKSFTEKILFPSTILVGYLYELERFNELLLLAIEKVGARKYVVNQTPV